jgi:hypothetical protein
LFSADSPKATEQERDDRERGRSGLYLTRRRAHGNGGGQRGAWRPGETKLTWPEAARSLGLFLLTGAACLGAAIGVLLPIADGSPGEALSIAARFIGFDQ